MKIPNHQILYVKKNKNHIHNHMRTKDKIIQTERKKYKKQIILKYNFKLKNKLEYYKKYNIK